MTEGEILGAVQDIARDVFDREDLVLEAATTADQVEEWDSLQHVRLLVAIERRFGFTFDNAEIEGLENVGVLVRVIHARVAAASA